SWVYSPLH
nr:Chain P, Phosphatidylinositol-4-phosphate 5-kinase type-1 gamma [synthetic construct]